MPVVVTDVLKIVSQFKVSGINTRTQNVYYWQTANLVDGDEANVGLDFNAKLLALMAFVSDWFSQDVVLEHLRMTNASQKTFVAQNFPVFSGGGGAGLSTPAQVAVECLGRATALGHTARKYMGPVIEATHTDGVLVVNAQTDFEAFTTDWAAQFVGGTTGNGYVPVMVKFAAGGAIDSLKDIDENLTTVIPTARTMRSRIPGRGLS